MMWLIPMLTTMTASGDMQPGITVPVSPGDIKATRVEAAACPSFTWTLDGTRHAETQLVVWMLPEDTQTAQRKASPGKQVINRLFPAGTRVWTPNRGECLRGNTRYAWSVRNKGEADWPSPLYFEIAGGVSTDRVRAALKAAGSVVPDQVPHGNRVPATARDDVRSFDRAPSSQARQTWAHGYTVSVAPSSTLLTGPDATSLYATTSISGGTNYAIHGITKSSNLSSAGIIGQSIATGGVTYGVVGVVDSPNGVGGVFESTGSGDVIRGFSAGIEVFSVTPGGLVSAAEFVGDGSTIFPAVGGLACATPCVSRSEIIDDSVVDSNLAPDSITNAKISGGAVTAIKIATDAVGTSELATNSVGEDEIANFSVGSAEIPANAVGSDELQTNEIEGVDIANNAITRSKIEGTEVEIYGKHPSCADEGDLTLSATCVSVQGGCSAGNFQTCGGGCTGTPQACTNSLEGYLIE